MLEFFDFLLKRLKISKWNDNTAKGNSSNEELMGNDQANNEIFYRSSDDNSSELGNYDESNQFIYKNSEKSLLIRKCCVEDTSQTINLKGLPLMYFFLSMSTIPLMIIITYFNDFPESYYNIIGPTKIHLLNYFSFSKVSALISYMIQGVLSIIGFMITLIITFYLFNRVGVHQNEDRSLCFSTKRLNQIKIIVMSFFGFFAFLVLFIESSWCFFDNKEVYNRMLLKEIGFSVPEFLLIIRGFFITAWVIFFLILISDKRLQGVFHQSNRSDKSLVFTNYKLVICIYLVITIMIYIVTKLHLDGFLRYWYKDETKIPIKNSLPYINAVFPYLINIIIDLLILTFGYELKTIRISISQMSLHNFLNDQEKNSL